PTSQLLPYTTLFRSNIDNIEMHARIDIPEIESCECEYDEIFNVKKSTFTLLADMDPEEYIRKNKLEPLQGDFPRNVLAYAGHQRSEEHTSELQSREN